MEGTSPSPLYSEVKSMLMSWKNECMTIPPFPSLYFPSLHKTLLTLLFSSCRSSLKDVNSSQFVQWMPNNVKCILTDPHHSSSSPSPTSVTFLFSSAFPSPTASSARVSATYLGNTSAIQDLFTPILADYDALFRRKAYLNPFTSILSLCYVFLPC